MIGLALWLTAVTGASALATSLASALALRMSAPLLERVAPRARARIWAFAALLPLAIAAFVAGAVLLPHPWLGLPEHCVRHDDDHLHLCLAHGAPAPSMAVLALALVLVARVAGGLVVELVHAARAAAALRRVRAACTGPKGEIMRLPLDAPLAFTAGWLRPQVFASASITGAPGWEAVLAHELDHARHRDPLARLAARFVATLHAPGIAAWIVRRLSAAQELAADEHAALTLGDRLEVAAQILALAREAARGPASAVAFAEGDLEARVGALLDPPRYVPGPSSTHALLLVALGGAATALAATSIHHAIEALLASIGA